MLLYSISFLLGVCIIQQLSVLPGTFVFLLLLICFISVILFRSQRFSSAINCLCMFVTGACWMVFMAQDYLDSRLPERLAGKDVLIEGKVSGIPSSEDNIQRFIIDVTSFDADMSERSRPGRLRLSWYYPGTEVRAGETWRLLVRLKPPHGVLNPAGFDYEAWLYQQGIHATGYVRKSDSNQRLKTSSVFSIDAIRQNIDDKIRLHLQGSQYRGLVAALAVGNRSDVQRQHWDDLIKTGTNHLMAISGLHIGLVAMFGYWMTRRLMPAGMMKHITAQQFGLCIGVLLALVYAVLAGLSIPTQRAIIMLVCVAVGVLMKRQLVPANVLSVALLLVLLNDPISVLAAGFWFSFFAVAVIFYRYRPKPVLETNVEETSSGFRYGKMLWQWGGLQLLIAFSLFPLSLLMFQQTSLVAPLANFVMVPLVSFVIVPLILIALVSQLLHQALAGFTFELVDACIGFIWPYLHHLAELQSSHWQYGLSGIWLTVLAMTGIAVLLSRMNKAIRLSGLLLIVPIFFIRADKPPVGDFELQLLDVGQGLSAIITTNSHVLVFDTGARFGDGLDNGRSVVLPNLRANGVETLDMLVISHGDNDHIGGAQSVLASHPETRLLGQDLETIEFDNKVLCAKGMTWVWDEVHFEFLHPDGGHYKKRNNRSCVLKISAQGGSLLLTGDIEKKVEKQLLKSGVNLANIDVLVAPHHGSKTSSSTVWIKQLNPKIVLFPVGYRNRYRLPSGDIIQRYGDQTTGQDRQLLSSASSGAIQILFSAGQGVEIKQQYRLDKAKYWHHKPLNFNNKTRL